MKKLIAVVLLLGLLLSMGMTTSVSGAETAEKPFYLVNWMDDVTDYENICMLLDFNASYAEGAESITMSVNWNGNKATNISKVAQIVKEEFDKRPEGTRYINYPLKIDTIIKPEAMVYLDKAVQLFHEWNEKFFKEYKDIGGKLDGVILDVEYSEIGAHYIHKAYNGYTSSEKDEEGIAIKVPANKNIYNEIVNHPLYATDIRPQLEELGFKFSTPSGDKAEIYIMSDKSTPEYSIWGKVMRNRMCKYINTAVEPILKYFPEIAISNYRFPSGKGWQESVSQSGGITFSANTMYAGNTANENMYLRRPYNDFFKTTSVYNTPAFYNKAVYEDSPFHSFMFEINTFKDMYESSDNKRINAWIAGFNYKSSASSPNGMRLTPYYSEAIYHLGLMNPEPFIGYIVGPRDTDLDGYDYDDNMLVCSELLDELTRLVGTADRKALSVPTQWNSDFVLSGMYSGGRNIWRLTPDTSEGTSLEEFKVKDKAPTFKIGGQTIIFPQGRIIEDSKVSYIGTSGYWVETPANVTPVVVNDADRYEKNPAYEENFDSYAVNTVFSSSAAKHKNAWNAEGSVLIREQNGNKALAMIGSAKLQNVKLPQNITAGDSFAKEQIWELTVTVPSSGVLKLLACAENDGGIKIADGKVYYDKAGAYEELSGVTLTAGSTYKLTRTVDFRASTFNSDYAVYDANGNSLGSVTDIPMASVELPVKAIENAATDVSEAAYIDDYRLRAIGVTTDFKLYDEKTGIELPDTDVARTENTVYRLSWMNATSECKVANVYNDGKIVAQVRMNPGADGVFIGAVEGNSKLSVKTANTKAVTLPDYDNGNFDWVAGEENPIEETEGTIPFEEETVTQPSEGVEATNPSEAPAPTNPGSEGGLSGGVIAAIAIAAAVVLAAGGFALYRFVIKPKVK